MTDPQRWQIFQPSAPGTIHACTDAIAAGRLLHANMH